MRNIFLFDIDGTLTPPRQAMVAAFVGVFADFAAANRVYLVSGSDLARIERQLPPHVLRLCAGVFGSSGAEFMAGGRLVYRRRHEFHPKLLEICDAFLAQSRYPARFGRHIEERPGTLNVSSVGRDASPHERRRYLEWDRVHGERAALVAEINRSDLGYEASAGGEISVDISPAGWNKSVVLEEVMRRERAVACTFFGDRMLPGGNDYPLARALRQAGPFHQIVQVGGFIETWRRLERLMEAKAA